MTSRAGARRADYIKAQECRPPLAEPSAEIQNHHATPLFRFFGAGLRRGLIHVHRQLEARLLVPTTGLFLLTTAYLVDDEWRKHWSLTLPEGLLVREL